MTCIRPARYQETIISKDIISNNLKLTKNRSGIGNFRFVDFWIEDKNGNKIEFSETGKKVTLVFAYTCENPKIINNVDVGFGINNRDDSPLSILYSSYMGKYYDKLGLKGEIRFCIDNLPFAKGKYRIGVRALVNGIEADWPRLGIGILDVEGSNFYERMDKVPDDIAPVLLSGKWS